MRRWRTLVLAAIVVGCKPAGEGEAPPDAVALVRIRVRADVDGNAGRPLHAVVRAVTFKDFVEDRYERIAELVIEPDETVLARVVVFPGKTHELEIPAPEGKAIGVYCLFTDATGTSWKRMFEQLRFIQVIVGRNRIIDDGRPS